MGFDPTAPSFHFGNLVQLMVARALQRAGHFPLLLVGGSTGLIGDPKETSERVLNPKETVAALGRKHSAAGREVFRLLWASAARIVNNLDWTGPMPVLDFLRDIGKHFPVNRMLSRDVVRQRLESGISYTEFSYVLLQALDYLELYRDLRLHAPIRRQRPVGQHHSRSGAHPTGRRGAGARAWPHLAHQGRRHEVRKDRERNHLARPGDDLSVRLISVLLERRG